MSLARSCRDVTIASLSMRYEPSPTSEYTSRAGSESLAMRSSVVPMVASRHASASSYMFQPSANVNVNPPPLVTHCG